MSTQRLTVTVTVAGPAVQSRPPDAGPAVLREVRRLEREARREARQVEREARLERSARLAGMLAQLRSEQTAERMVRLTLPSGVSFVGTPTLTDSERSVTLRNVHGEVAHTVRVDALAAVTSTRTMPTRAAAADLAADDETLETPSEPSVG